MGLLQAPSFSYGVVDQNQLRRHEKSLVLRYAGGRLLPRRQARAARQRQARNNNLPDILARWKNRTGEESRERTAQSFCVPKADIAAKNYDLSLNRYREVVQETVHYDPPEKILDELDALEGEIQQGLARLRIMLKEQEMTA